MTSSVMPQRRRHGPLTSTFAVVYLAASMGLLTVLFVPPGASSLGLGSTPAFVAAWAVLYLLTLVLFLYQRLELDRTDLLLVSGAAALMFSGIWSARPLHSVAYGGTVLLNLLFVAQLVRYWDCDAAVRLMLKVITATALIGLIGFSIGFEATTHIDPHERLTLWGTIPMRGLFNHKITAGYYSAIGIALALGFLRGIRRVLVVSFLGFFALLTGSATGLAAAVSALFAFGAVHWSLRRRLSLYTFVLLLAVMGVFASIAAVLLLPKLLPLVGRDPTLTGRTLLWAWGWSVGNERPLVGWGYLGYLGSDAAIAYARSMRAFLAYEVPHFHNSYIQAFVDLGIAGVVGYLGLLLLALRNTYTLALERGTRGATALAAVVLLIGFSGMFMNLFFKHNDFTTILLAFAVVGVSATEESGA